VRQVDELRKAGFKEAEAIELLNKYDVQSDADLERLLGRKESLLKRSAKALEKRMKLGEEDYSIIKQLNPLVGSVGNRDITFAGWASTEPSARSYIKEKKKKGWSVLNTDLDGDGVGEVLVKDKDGIIRRVNGWGVKESLRPIRYNYFTNNPSITDRRNITHSEWTRGVQLDKDGNIGYLFPDAVRYKKSRQQYYAEHPNKVPQVNIKHIWQQYWAQPLIQLAKEKNPELFAELNALPGLASAALSQQFSTQGFTYLRCKALLVNNDNRQGVKTMQDIIDLIMSREYGDEGYAEKRKENNKKLNDDMKKDGEAQGRIHLDVTDIADAAADNDVSSQLAQEMMQILTAVYNYILREYGDQGRVNVLTGSSRYTSNY